jgi:hypothetical protein
MAAPPLADAGADIDADEPQKGWSRSAKIQVAILVVNVAFWGAILGWTVTVDEDDIRPPGQMQDLAFAAAAEPVCASAETAIDQLGLPTAVETPDERADLVDAENVILRGMLDDLDALPRPQGEEGGWVEEWLGDWRTHVQDRQNWADGLRAGDDGPFTETDRGGEQLSKGIDFFAETNDMPSCVTTGDV